MKTRALLARKIGMTQVFKEDGKVVPVCIVKAGPCKVLEKKSSLGRDKYSAIKIGFEAGRPKSMNKPQLGYFKKAGTEPMKEVREIRLDEEHLDDFEVGGDLTVSLFEPGDIVNVIGKSKGRGFTGVIKRWGFSGKRATHGTHECFRHPGSVGCSAWPSRIFKGKKMPGQYGNEVMTIENLEVVRVVPEENLLFLKGAVPGARNSLILVRNSRKKWKRN